MMKHNLSKKSWNRMLNDFEYKLKRTKLASRPVYLTIEPTDACNSRCVMCNKRKLYGSPGFRPGFMSREIFEKVLPFVSYATSTCWGGFGEPFLHPFYGEWAGDLKNAGACLLCFTNGITMNKGLVEKLVAIQFDHIVISIGGATEQKYKDIRGVNGLRLMLNNLTYLNEVKKACLSPKPYISFNLVAMNSVLPELEAVIRLAHEFDVRQVSMPDLDVQYEESVKESIWTNIARAREYVESADRVAQQLGVKLVPPTLSESVGDCRAFFRNMQITYDGVVLSCPKERYILGSLKENTINEVWNNSQHREKRKEYFVRGLRQMCPVCEEWDKSERTLLTVNVDFRDSANRTD
jgi:radical SAM protein with 4Fe4S-binding SPASM domain